MQVKETLQQSTSIVPMCVVSPDGTIQFCNQALINTLGKTSDLITGRKCRETFNCTTADTGHCPLSALGTSPCMQSVSMRRGTCALGDTCEPMLDSAGTVTAILLSFPSGPQSQAIRPGIIKLQKLETMAEAAGGIVHDLNNIFMRIQGMAEHLREQLKEYSANHESHQSLTSILQAISKGHGLTRHLLKLSKGQRPETAPMHIGETIRESVDFSLLGSFVPCIVRISDDLNPVTTNDEQIFQLISNLVTNARHATASNRGGRITITADNLPDDEVKRAGLKPGNYVRITVQDEGQGFPPEHMESIFEPFFTTKPEGTGLGLSLVKLIVKELSGQITVESTVGKGSKFTVLIPAIGR